MVQPEKVYASDLMQHELVQLHASTPIERAVETFEEYKISGAPVVNEADDLVGVLSASDIVKTEHVHQGRIEAQRGEYYFSDPFSDDWSDSLWGDDGPFSAEDYSPAVLGRETVGDWMTPSVVAVAPDDTLQGICALMARERIHRVFVVKDKAPVGVITSFDVVSYLADNP